MISRVSHGSSISPRIEEDPTTAKEKTKICNRFYNNRFEVVPSGAVKRSPGKVSSPRKCGVK